MEDFSNVLINAAEFIKGRLFFVSLNTEIKPKSIQCAHYFSIDNKYIYERFYMDFGPLNLSMLYHYCEKLQEKLNSPSFQCKKIVHYTGPDEKKRVNAAYLIGSYAVIYLGMEPERAYEILTRDNKKEYLEFRDASIWEPYTISLLDCLKSIKKAYHYGYFNFDDFDYVEYEHYERVEKGDLNWIVPNKFIAFCGPYSPETYFNYFRRNKINTIVRLNKKVYDSNKFIQAGFDHLDLYFVDGGTPTEKIVQKFLNACESKKGGFAVHCKAGLGRTGTLIACYIMKHYKFTAEEAIAWVRICRPGSVIGHQQTFLKSMQDSLWAAGEEYRKQKGMSGPVKHSVGIYSTSEINNKIKNDNVTGIMKKVDSMELNDREENFKSEENKPTQGDKLNEIKALRAKAKPLGSNLSEPRTFLNKANIGGTVLRSSKVIPTPVKTAGASTTRVLTKRNEILERRCSLRKVNISCEKSKETSRQPKKKEHVSWLSKAEPLENEVPGKSVKRGKRSLNLEKDKTNPRSIKLLRFSPDQTTTSNTNEKIEVKLRLPVVKNSNKTL